MSGTESEQAADAILFGSDKDKFAALAQLELAHYDRLRQGVAEGMGIRVATLDFEVARRRSPQSGTRGFTLADVPQWSEPVDGAELLDEIAAQLASYIVMPAASRDAVALWILLTFVVPALFILPMLVIVSPQKRCGKSTLLILLHKLCNRALLISNTSPAALYRVVETYRPTLLLDEADAWARENEELRGLLNCGHSRETAHVLRVDGEKLEPRIFDCFAPKALAGIGGLADTIEDRSIVIGLKRRAAGESVQQLRQDRLDLSRMKSMAARWAADHMEEIRNADAVVPAILNDRAADNWRGPQAIADLAGGDWPERARAAATSLSANDRDEDDVTGMLLADIQELLERNSGRMGSQDLCSALAAMTERPWSEWKHGKPISPPQLARRLRPFGIATRNLRTLSGILKGYDVTEFGDTFARYLKKPSPAATPLQAAENSTESTKLAATGEVNVADRNATAGGRVAAANGDFLGKNSTCSGVAGKSSENEVFEI